MSNILIITITSFYAFNHHMSENCDGKTLSYVVARRPVYNIFDIYVTYICINDICYILIIYFLYILIICNIYIYNI